MASPKEEKFARWLAWMVTGSPTRADQEWEQFLEMAREGIRLLEAFDGDA